MKSPNQNTKDNPAAGTYRSRGSEVNAPLIKAVCNTLTDPVSVIIPAFNEEACVSLQIRATRDELSAHGVIHEIIVVDDGSQDRTAEEALMAGARVLRHAQNRGYGSAIKTGILAATHENIVISDADGTYPADEIPNLLANLDEADMVVGARIGDSVHIPWPRRPAKLILGWLANRIAGQTIPDLNSGLRVFRRDSVKQYFPILSNQFSFTTTVTLAFLADDYRVIYHPVNYYRRIGKSKIRPRHFTDFVVLVLRMAMLFQPLRIFVPLALLCGLLGALKLIYDIFTLFQRSPTFEWSLFFQPAVSTTSVLLMLVGLQLLLIGMVADGILRRIAQHNGPPVPSRAVVYSQGVLSPQPGDGEVRSTHRSENGEHV